jgi:hypothetical protein
MDEVLRRHNTSFDEVVDLTTDVLKISARIVFSVGTDALRTRIGDLDPPAYIRLMCGRFTSRLMWPSLYFLAGRRAFRAQINESARKCSYYLLFSGGA